MGCIYKEERIAVNTGMSNKEKFNKVLEKRGITSIELNKLIGRYASKIHYSSRNANILSEKLKEQIGAKEMSDKSFLIALKIIGVTPEEIITLTSQG
jgi:hypothetical protein